MGTHSRRPRQIIAAAAFCLMGNAAQALEVDVRGPAGQAVGPFRWLVQEDTTHAVVPGQPTPTSLGVRFHASHAPAVAEGKSSDGSLGRLSLDPSKRYFLSVLPEGGYSIGGAPLAPGQTKAKVEVAELPLPTAQISVFVFEDNSPINNQADLPAEHGLAGFTIILEDAGGRYGQVGGRVTQDAFGNPLGTTYDAGGNVLVMGNGELITGPDGKLLIKNLSPAKYGVKVIPPSTDWVQTSTIEGTRTIDAWVKPNEPPFFTEFGPASEHVVVGFLKPSNDASVLTGGVTLKGRVVNQHMSRPPEYTMFNGNPFEHTNCWVGLNSMAAGAGRGVYAQKCGDNGSFSVPNVPPGSYQLAFWDDNLDLIFATLGVTVNPDGTCNTAHGSCDLVEVPMFNWFAALHSRVFLDKNQNGFPDEGEPGIPNVPVNIRFRDGTVYQSFTTDNQGKAPFDEVFPFFHWLVAEVDFSRFKATGATIVVDAGGPVPADAGWQMPSGDALNPQPQAEPNPNTGNNLSRTETGPVLLQAFQAYLGQTNRIDWGKAPYADGENGGISGMVVYATTRAENDPRFAVADPWEPGIPRVQVNLYRDQNGDGAIDDVAEPAGIQLADVDNYPFGWKDDPSKKGPEDIDRNSNGRFDLGDAIAVTTSDSFDDNPPTGCQGEKFVLRGLVTDCYDGIRNFNQVRPGVFDGGYAFADIPAGSYVVEAVPPPGYTLVKEEDVNVAYGDSYKPNPAVLAPVCVGDKRVVPAKMSFPRGANDPAPFAGQTRPLCDKKQITLADKANAAADFHLFTQVPIAGQAVGMVLNDLANEFDITSPQFGEKYAVPWIPVAIRDWSGREIARVYTDEWGRYNALLPSTYTADRPMPSGMAPNMLILCMNDAGPIPDPAHPGQTIIDPQFNRQYSQFCYTFQFMPGTTTYLDTPVLPIAAFAGPDRFSVDCRLADGTPQVFSASGFQGGPYVTGAKPKLTIVAQGPTTVPNPAYDGPGGSQPQNITRDFGFGGTKGTVKVAGVPLTNVTWSDGIITGDVPFGTPSGHLEIVRANGKKSVDSVFVTVGPLPNNGTVRHVAPSSDPLATPIQNAIDNANPGDLILVAPGRYEEMPILWKPVSLQGWGAGSTSIVAVRHPGEKIAKWQEKLASVLASGRVTPLPGQTQASMAAEEGAGILVLGRNVSDFNGGFGPRTRPRIDGFTITGSDNGGGIVVNAHAKALEISNNRIQSNYGLYGGGVRVGHALLEVETQAGASPVDANNDDVRIHHNQITQNGSMDGAGGGVAVCTGSDYYRVADNFICGNFTQGEGGGIGHFGYSREGRIERNTIAFNQSFNQGRTVSGGGIFIGGKPAQPGLLSDGSGNVKILANRIQGNHAGAGDGGGIRIARANGSDVARNRNRPNNWHEVAIYNNMIVDNVAGLAGGGVSLQDATRVRIIHNTIAHNDSTATAGEAFTPGNPNQSNPQPAGIVARAHSPELKAQLNPAQPGFSNPSLFSNIVWKNRSFRFMAGWDQGADKPTFGLSPDVEAGEAPVYNDLAVLGATGALDPRQSVLTKPAGTHASNTGADPALVAPYVNGSRRSVLEVEAQTAIAAQPAFDEGGNFIEVHYGPLTLIGDSHIGIGSSAVDAGNVNQPGQDADLQTDFDGQPRPAGRAPDIGADERQAAN